MPRQSSDFRFLPNRGWDRIDAFVIGVIGLKAQIISHRSGQLAKPVRFDSDACDKCCATV
jgi:hypothetical protein